MNYSDSEKSAIVAEYKQGIPIKGLSIKYEISERTIYRWAKQYPIEEKETTPTVKKYNQLLHRVKKLEDIISILKTVNCTFRAPLKEKLAELELLYGQYDFIHFVRLWMFLVAPFITISFAINVVTHGLRSAGMNTVF